MNLSIHTGDGGRVQLIERAGDKLQGFHRSTHGVLHHCDHGLHVQVGIEAWCPIITPS